MNKLNSQSLEIEWVEQVYQLLMEMARAALSSDIPRLPANISQKAIPLLQKAHNLLESAAAQSLQEREWTEDIDQLLREVCSVSLSEVPRLPDNLAQRCLTLADRAKDIKEGLEAETGPTEEEADPSLPSPESLLTKLRESLKGQRQKSHNPDASEWQQVFTLLDVVETTYRQIR